VIKDTLRQEITTDVIGVKARKKGGEGK